MDTWSGKRHISQVVENKLKIVHQYTLLISKNGHCYDTHNKQEYQCKKKSAGSKSNNQNREKDTIFTGDLDSQRIELNRRLGRAKTEQNDKQNNNPKKKQEMFTN
jgi:hypothetical protein